jgi:hypothetical protein
MTLRKNRRWLLFETSSGVTDEDADLDKRPFAHIAKAFEGLRPVFFGPCTLVRTWGTRPEP